MSKQEKKRYLLKNGYIVKNGKYGAYFYDTNSCTDLTLKEVENMLNEMNKQKNSEIDKDFFITINEAFLINENLNEILRSLNKKRN